MFSGFAKRAFSLAQVGQNNELGACTRRWKDQIREAGAGFDLIKPLPRRAESRGTKWGLGGKWWTPNAPRPSKMVGAGNKSLVKMSIKGRKRDPLSDVALLTSGCEAEFEHMHVQY
jgi:hypothetical protein